jgi:hypothetical protein
MAFKLVTIYPLPADEEIAVSFDSTAQKKSEER